MHICRFLFVHPCDLKNPPDAKQMCKKNKNNPINTKCEYLYRKSALKNKNCNCTAVECHFIISHYE